MKFKTIDKDRLKAWVDDGRDFILISVLSESDFKEGHIRRSLNVDFGAGDFIRRVEEIAPNKEKPVVVYCYAGNTSPRAAEKLVEAGYRQVLDYSGGLDEWEEAGFPLENSGV